MMISSARATAPPPEAMEEFHKVKITEVKGAANFIGTGPVMFDNFEIKGVQGYTYDASIDRPKTLTFTILVDDITIETVPDGE
jgi:hypothetical protein